MNARFEQRAGNLCVRFGRHGETHRIAASQQRAPVGRPLSLSFGGDVARRRFVKVADGDELRLSFGGERGVNPRVLATEMSDADDGCA